MTAAPEPRDTRESVEAMAARCDNAHRIMLSGAFYADAAAMLRRLVQRAEAAEVEAERLKRQWKEQLPHIGELVRARDAAEADRDQRVLDMEVLADACTDIAKQRDEARAALATAREDALREARAAVDAEPAPRGPMPSDMRQRDPELLVRAAIAATKRNICRTPSEIEAHAAAAWRDGVEAAADDADCGCLHRPQVLEHRGLGGERRARMFCPHGDACCALQAASIRALTPPPEFAAALERVREGEREACVALVESEPEPDGPIPTELAHMDREFLVRASIQATKNAIAAAIRARSAGGAA